MSFAWYIQRIKTFSPEEVLYRVNQRIRTHIIDKHLQQRCFENPVLPSCGIVQDASLHLDYPIFEKHVDIFKSINWHLDVQSGKCFPQTFSHKINIRSDEFGSAKHVWEVNRQLFLVHIAKLYSETLDRRYLELVMYHLTSWKMNNPYLIGVNWYSNIEVNIRLINWYYCWQLLDIDSLQNADHAVCKFVRDVWLPLIFDHVEFSHKHPSLYSSANNHLVAEYAGLFVAACKWNIPHREMRLKYAQKGLEREILLQNSSDGVNREEAAEYIQFIDDFFLLAAVVGDTFGHPFSDTYKERLHQMARYLNAMLDIKYNYPMYGDGDDGFLLRPDAGGHFNNFQSLLTAFSVYFCDAKLKRSDALWDEKNQLILGQQGKNIFDSLAALGDNSCDNVFLSESGHYIFRKVERESRREIYMHFDAAPLGFLSIAAHGHADALSFILHVDGEPVIVDPGTFTYHTHKDWRKYFVGTLAHNTVRINGMNQALQAGPTLWLNHYKCKTNCVEKDAIKANHSGYEKIGVHHSRRVAFNRDDEEFLILDELVGNSDFEVEIPFHLHPDANVSKISQNTFDVIPVRGRRIQIETDLQLEYRIVCGEEGNKLGWYSCHFGERVPCHVLYARKKCNGKAVFATKVRIVKSEQN